MGKIKELVPNSPEAEKLLLGWALCSGKDFTILFDELEEKDFYFFEHREIFAALKIYAQVSCTGDLHLVSAELKKRKSYDSIGGVTFLTEVAHFASSVYNVDQYIEIVKSKSILRAMITAAQEIDSIARKDPIDIGSALEQAERSLSKITSQRKSESVSTEDILCCGGFLESIERDIKDPDYFEKNNPIIRTGFKAVDDLVDGFMPGHLVIIAARPSMGKTAFSLNLALNMVKEALPVLFFSIEMTKEQIMNRLLCALSGVSQEDLKRRRICSDDFEKIRESAEVLKNTPIFICERPGISISEIRSNVRQMVERNGVKAVFVDYLQLITSSLGGRYENRQVEVSEICKKLKQMAKEFDVPVICCAQLSRRVEERTGHRPVMSDLRESGSLEQDSDLVSFLLRPSFYDPIDRPGLTEFIVAKNRHGNIGNVKLMFEGKTGVFKDSIF